MLANTHQVGVVFIYLLAIPNQENKKQRKSSYVQLCREVCKNKARRRCAAVARSLDSYGSSVKKLMFVKYQVQETTTTTICLVVMQRSV